MPVKKNKHASETPETKKDIDLNPDKERSDAHLMTTNQGVKINDDQNSLKAGDRGSTLMEDFIFREKMTHFDHERIPNALCMQEDRPRMDF